MGEEQTDCGIVRKTDEGRDEVYFERRLKHSNETAWRAIADPEVREVWLPQFRFAPEPNAPLPG